MTMWMLFPFRASKASVPAQQKVSSSGCGVIKEFGKASGADELAQAYIKHFAANEITIKEYTKKVFKMLLIRDEFLTY